MSLFVVNRYEDEDWKQETNNSQDHLSDLLKRIAERKQEREAASKALKESKVETNVTQTDQVVEKEENGEITEHKSKKKKKGKKRKIESNIDQKTIDVQNEETMKLDSLKSSNENQSIETAKENFTILGAHKKLKTKAAKRVLPNWLTHPEIVDSNLNSGLSLDELDKSLNPKLIAKLKLDGFSKLFPIQARTLCWLLKCDKDYRSGKWVRDTCVSMPTGSGKTLSYVLPIVQVLENSFVRLVRCLIVLPVQELANQVHEVVLKYSIGTGLRVALITGASSFKEEQQRLVQKSENREYISCVDIVIATPGRLVDHIRKTDGFSLSALRFLVIDEADRATDWLQYIPYPHNKAPPLSIKTIQSSANMPAQKILLSATLSQDPEKLSKLGLFRPILFTSMVADFESLDKDINLDETITNRYGNPSELKERFIQCTTKYKPLVVYNLLIENKVTEKTLVFTNSSNTAHRLANLLQSLLKSKNVTVGELSAQLGSKKREETLEQFKQGKIQIMVSSDALARGLDIPGIKLVVSYDPPKFIKGYIHRAGRTGRAGIPGTAVSILLPMQISRFKDMMNKVGRKVAEVEEKNVESLAESVDYESHLKDLHYKMIAEEDENHRRQKSIKRVIK